LRILKLLGVEVEQRLGAAGFGERQTVVDQRADAAGGEVVQGYAIR
jgi:hypothetical protein